MMVVYLKSLVYFAAIKCISLSIKNENNSKGCLSVIILATTFASYLSQLFFHVLPSISHHISIYFMYIGTCSRKSHEPSSPFFTQIR